MPGAIGPAPYLCVCVAVVLLTPAGVVALAIPEHEPLSRHMAVHLLLMNIAAPLLALVGRELWRPSPSAYVLASATALQMIGLWLAHLPRVLSLAHTPATQTALHALLFILALWFWWNVLAPWGAARWRPLAALLLTGKLACLLGVLLVFAARPLYPDLTTIADQQQAGLWMVAACLFTYVLAAVALAAQWLRDLGLTPARSRTGE